MNQHRVLKLIYCVHSRRFRKFESIYLFDEFFSVGCSRSLRMNKIPNERSRLYFLLAWFHAVIQERLRYVPLGWSKHYEFTEADLKCALDTIDIWIDMIAMGRTNLPIDKIPWEALRTLLSQCIYGGRIDNPFDQRLLNGFLSKLFSLTSLNTDMKLIVEEQDEKVQQPVVVTMPDGVKREQFMNWIEQTLRTLIQQPSWLGLPNNAEIVLLTTRARETIAKLLKMSSVITIEDEDIQDSLLPESTSASDVSQQSKTRSNTGDGRPTWMKQLHNSCATWLKLLPSKVTTMKRTTENIKDPLFRFFEREVNTGSKLLSVVQSDLRDIIAVCETKKKQTNYHRQLISDLIKGKRILQGILSHTDFFQVSFLIHGNDIPYRKTSLSFNGLPTSVIE